MMRNHKIGLLLLCLALIAALLSSCAYFPYMTLNGMTQVEERNEPAPEATVKPAVTVGEDQVVISREEYESYRRFDSLIEILELTEENFYEDLDEEKLIQGAAAGLLQAVDDPYTFYYSLEDYAELWEDDEGEYAGIGIQISANYATQICTITRVFKNGPAEGVGMRKGDILYRVGEDLYVNADNLQDAVDIMRGTPGTPVDVTFLRNGEELTFTIVRATVTVNRIDSAMLPGDIAYIRLYEFAGECEVEFANALSELEEQGAKGVIIDLRDNGGGWVDAANKIGDLFLDEGILCYLQYKNGYREYYRTKNGKTDMPIVILVNQYTASSSEILTGALKDRANATVVGVQSYGKGVVQAVLSVGNKGEGMQVTIAQYFTPNGNAVHKIGITPDVVSELPEGDPGDYDLADVEHDIQLQKAVEVMLEKLGVETPVAEPAPEEDAAVEQGL